MDSIDAPQIIEHVKQTLSFMPQDTKWIPTSARIVCCGVSTKNKGVLNIYEIMNGSLNPTLELLDIRPHGVKCATFRASRIQNRQIALGDCGGSMTIFDVERLSTLTPAPLNPLFSTKAHNGIVNAIDGIGGTQSGCGASELVTGGSDGNVHVWDPRVDCAVASLEPQTNNSPRDCWTVAFGNSYNTEERCVCAGYDNGDIKMFDLRTNSVLWEDNCKNAVTSIEFDRQDIKMNKMVVTTLESKFRTYDLRTQHSKDGFAFLIEKAHRSTVWIARHLPQNRDIFITGGGNGGLNLYKYHYPSKRFQKHANDGAPIGNIGSVELLNSRILSTQPIISFDWSPDREGLCCMSCLDQTLRISIISKLSKH